MSDKLYLVNISRIHLGGSNEAEQIAMRFPTKLKFLLNPSGQRIPLEAPAVWRERDLPKIDLITNQGVRYQQVKHEIWLTVNDSLEETIEHRIAASILEIQGEDLSDFVHRFRMGETFTVEDGENESVNLHDYLKSKFKPFEMAAEEVACSIIWINQTIDKTDVYNSVIRIPGKGFQTADENIAWQMTTFLLIFEETLGSLLHLAEKTLGRQLDALKAAAKRETGTTRAINNNKGMEWNDLIQVGQLRHAWALMITQEQELVDAAQEGSQAYRFIKDIMMNFGIGQKTDAVANVLSAAEQLISVKGNKGNSDILHVEKLDNIASLFRSLIDKGIDIQPILVQLEKISLQTRESTILNKLMLTTIIIVGLVVVGKCLFSLL